MNARKCDRCGKFFEIKPSGKFDGGKIILFDLVDYWSHETAKITRDLCEDCKNDFERWLKNENQDN